MDNAGPRTAGEMGTPSLFIASPNHERYAPADDPCYLLDKALAFLASEVRSLAGAPQRRDAVHPGLYKALHDRFGGPEVNLSPLRRRA